MALVRASVAERRTGCARDTCGCTRRTWKSLNAGAGDDAVRRCCRWRTVADCCWGQRSTARLRRSRCGWFRGRRSTRRSGWSCWQSGCSSAIARRKPMLTDGDRCVPACASARRMSCRGWSSTSTASLVILQLLTKGLDSAAVRDACVRVLREELDPAAIVERPDPRVRELEGLSAPSAEALYRGATSAAKGSERNCRR